ncbi:MAG: hypothetical protein IJG60_00725 [Thermoguttaceae bacterium]|nr:hypothetical protein [Thermoguttaceae bacterium]
MSDNQEDLQVSNEPVLSDPHPAEADTPLSGLSHSKVTLGVWYAESVIFAKRYFWSLFLLGIVMAVLLFYGASSGNALSCLKKGGFCGLKSALNMADSANAVYADDDDDADDDNDDDDDDDADDDDDDDDHDTPAAVSAAPGSDGSSSSAASAAPAEAVAASSAAASDAAGSAGAADASASVNVTVNNSSAAAASDGTPAAGQAEAPVKKECQICYPICAVLWGILWWMALCWGIRTVQKDNPSWKNLLFPSWQTLLKLIVLGFIVLCFAAAVYWGVLLLLGSFGTLLCGIVISLILIYFALKLFLSANLIIDRNCGPLQAIGTSWRFMRGNVWTLFAGLFLFDLIVGIFSFIVTFIVIGAASKLGGGAEQASGAMAWLPTAIRIVISALVNVGILALGSVFYLTATGQRRPGAWPRENA